MRILTCPYCLTKQEPSADQSEPEIMHEHECISCEKNFVFTVEYCRHYSERKADCLNGTEHRLKLSIAYPRQYSKMKCKDCGFERSPTQAELEVSA